jgi:hypothetical protein
LLEKGRKLFLIVGENVNEIFDFEIFSKIYQYENSLMKAKLSKECKDKILNSIIKITNIITYFSKNKILDLSHDWICKFKKAINNDEKIININKDILLKLNENICKYFSKKDTNDENILIKTFQKDNEIKSNKIKYNIIITEKISQNIELIQNFNERNIFIIAERNKSLFSPCDIVLNENECVLYYKSDEFSNDLIDEMYQNLISINIQYKKCMILIEFSKE